MLLTYISVRYSLNYFNAYPNRNNPAQATQSRVITNFNPSYITLKYIQVRNPLSFNFSPKNYSIKGNLTFTILILLILSSNIWLLSYKRSTIFYIYPRVTIYKSVSAILVSLLALNVVAAVISVIVGAFSSILFDFFYYNYSSNYIIEPSRKYYGRFY